MNLLAGLVALPAAAQGPAASGNPFLHSFYVVLGLVLIWAFFYTFLYPRLLPHFGEGGSRAIFWPGFTLYSMAWIHLSSYLIFTYGFYYLWLQRVALALVGFVSLWFLWSFSRRS